jgi:hypothetical protein
VSQRSRLRNQDGFIREVVWIVVVLAVIAVVILDGMAIFSASQSVGDDATTAAEEARTEYAQSLDFDGAKLAAARYLANSGLDMTAYKVVRTANGVRFTVTAEASANTYAFKFLAGIPPLKDWVERTTHPVRSGSAE